VKVKELKATGMGDIARALGCVRGTN
jgi:hypothetical protein